MMFMSNPDNNDNKQKRDENMSKIINNGDKNKNETRSNIENILNKGIERYDKALEKLSKN